MVLMQKDQSWQRIGKGLTLLATSSLLFTFSLTAGANSKNQMRSMRNQIKVMRLRAEITGTEFQPSVEMIQEAPEIVKAEMKKFQQHSEMLKKLHGKVKNASAQVKLFESLHKRKLASQGELRKKLHAMKSFKSQMLKMQIKTLSDFESELILDAKADQQEKVLMDIQAARISAELNEKPFNVTQEMRDQAPEFVKAQEDIFKAHSDHLDVIDSRIDIASDELKLAKNAFNKGYLSKTEYLETKQKHNRLVNENLKLHCQILTHSEQMKIESSGFEKSELGKKLKMERIKAHVNGTEFAPSDKMKQMVPNLVVLEKQLYDCNTERFDLLGERENMLQENYKLTNKAFKAGVATQVEYKNAKQQLDQFQDYRYRLKQHFERELTVIMASLDVELDYAS